MAEKKPLRVQIEAEAHYWNDFLDGLDILLRNPNLSSDVRSATSHMKVKLVNGLTGLRSTRTL